jgi:Cu-processing system ATP-binding protein
MDAISATDVRKTYGSVTALDRLSLTVESGTTFGLLGTNGAGKTTLFKLLVGHTRPDGGELEVAGRDVAGVGSELRRRVGYLPEDAGFPPSLTGREVLRFHARMRGFDGPDRAARVDEVLETVGLAGAADREVEGYSNGMNRRLGLATALLARPRILLLDEPTAGLDPLGVATFHRIVRRLRAESDLTVILSSHVLTEVEALCDSIGVLHEGRLLTTGSVADLKRRLGGGATVRVELADSGAVEDALAVASERGHGGRRAGDRRVEIACPVSDVAGLLDDLADRIRIAGLEVTEPGLEEVFAAALDDSLSEPEVMA